MTDDTAFGRGAVGDLRERACVAAFIALLLALSAAPYWAAWHASPSDSTYTGVSEASLDDYPTYLAKMRAGARGEWNYRSPYAPELESSIQVRPFYAAVGALTALFSEKSWHGYHAARLLMGGLCLWLVFRVASAVSRGGVERWSAFALASVGSGVGWLLGREGPRVAWSYDLWVPELNVFHSLLTNPHFPLSIVLMLATLLGVSGTLETGRLRYAALGGLALGLLSLVHPYDDFPTVGALVVYGGVSLATGRHRFAELARAAGVLALAAAPGVAWMAASYWSDPSLANMGNAQPVGPIGRVVSGLGLLLPLAALGLHRLATRGPLGGLLCAWALVVPLLMCVPLEFPRRMVAGWQVPLGMAAGLGLAACLAPWARRSVAPWAAALAIALASVTSFDIALRQIQNFANPGRNPFPFHLPSDLMDAFAWLDENASEGDIVLAPYGPSNWLPVYTDLRPYFGHWAETPGRREREAAREAFYRGRGDPGARAEFLRENRIAWIFDGPLFQQQGYLLMDAARNPGVRLAHRAGGIVILRVLPVEGLESAGPTGPTGPARPEGPTGPAKPTGLEGGDRNPPSDDRSRP